MDLGAETIAFFQSLGGWDQVVDSIAASASASSAGAGAGSGAAAPAPPNPMLGLLRKYGIAEDVAAQVCADSDIQSMIGTKKHKIKFDHASALTNSDLDLDYEAESTYAQMGSFKAWTDVTGTGPPQPGSRGSLQAVNFTRAEDAIKSLEERVLAWKSLTTAQIEVLNMAKEELTKYCLENACAESDVPMTPRMVYCMDSALMLQHKSAALISAITGSLYIPMRINIHMVNPAHESCHAAFTNLFSAMDVAAKEALRAAHHAGMAAQSRGSGGKTPNEIVELLAALRVQYLHSLMIHGKYGLSRNDWRRTYLLQETMLSWENLLSNSAMAIGSRITETGICSLESFGLGSESEIMTASLPDLAQNILFSASTLGESGGGDCAWPNMASTGRVTETASMGSEFAQNSIHNIKLMTQIDQANTVKNILDSAKLKLTSASRLYNKLTLNAEKRAWDRYSVALSADLARSRSDTVFLALGDARATATEDAEGRLQITGIYDPRLLNRSKLGTLDRRNVLRILVEDEFVHGTPHVLPTLALDRMSAQIRERCFGVGVRARTYSGRVQRQAPQFDLAVISEAAASAAASAAAQAAAEAAAAEAIASIVASENMGQDEVEPVAEPPPALVAAPAPAPAPAPEPRKKRKISTLDDAVSTSTATETDSVSSSISAAALKLRNIKHEEAYKQLAAGKIKFITTTSDRQQKKHGDEFMRRFKADVAAETERRFAQMRLNMESSPEYGDVELSRTEEAQIRKDLYDMIFEEKKLLRESLAVDLTELE